MKKHKRLGLSKETIRRLGTSELQHAFGGLSGRRCSIGLTGCGECQPHNSINNSACDVCATEVDCATGNQCLTFEPGCGGGGAP